MKTTFSIIFVFAFVFIKFEKAQATSKTNQLPTINAYVSLTDPSNLRNVRVSLINSLDPDGNITKYQINFGDGYVSTKSDDEHQYSQDGSFTIKAKVWDNKNAVTEFTKTVQIKSNLVLSESVEAWSVADIKKNKQYSFNVSPNYVGSVYKVVLSHRENSSRWANLLAWLNDLLRRLTGKHNAKLEFALEINNISVFGANEVKDDTLKIEKLVSLKSTNVVEAQFKNAEDDKFDIRIFRLNVTEDVLPPIIASDIQSGGVTRNNQLPIRVSDLSGVFTTTVWRVNALAQLSPPNDSNATYQFLFTTTESNFNILLSEGANSFVLQSSDGFGHVSYYFYLSNIILDTRGPGIALRQPANVSTVYVDHLPVSYGVQPVFSEQISGWSLNGTNYANTTFQAIAAINRAGANSFTVTATDLVGNTSTFTQNFNVIQIAGETTLDLIRFNTPYRSGSAITNTRHVSFSYKVDTPLPEVEIKFFLNGLDDDGESIPFATSFTKQGTMFVDLPDQYHSFVYAAVYAKNAGYNGFMGVYSRSPAIATTAQQILFEADSAQDNVAPQLTSSLPANGSLFYVNSFPQQKNLQLYFNEPLSQIKIDNGVAVPMLSASSYQTNFNFSHAGINQVQIEATDLAGNVAYLTYTLDFNFSDTKPVIKFDDAVVNMLTNLVTVPISGTSDKSLTNITLNGQPLVLASGGLSFSGYFDAPANGRFKLTLDGVDKWGNVGTAETYIRVLQQLPDRLLHPDAPILRYDDTTRTYTPDFGNPFRQPQTDGTCDILDQIFNSEIEFKDYLSTMDRNSRQLAYDTIDFGHKNLNSPSRQDLKNFMGDVDETLNDLKAPYLIMCKGYNIDPDQACSESRQIFRILMGTYPEPLIIRAIPGIPLSVQDFLIRRINICTGFDTSGLTCDEMVKFMPLIANIGLPSLGQLMGSPAGQFVTEAFVCKDKCDNPLTASSPECLIKSLPEIPSVGPLPTPISIPGAPVIGGDFGGGDTWHGGGGGGSSGCGGFFSFCGGGGGGGIDIDIGSGDFACSVLPDLFPCGGGENSVGTDHIVIDIGNVDCGQLSTGNIGSLVADAASRGLPLMTSFSTYLAKCLVSPVPNYPHMRRPVITVLTPVQNQQADTTVHVTGYVDDFYAVVRVNGVDVTTRSGFQGAYFDVTIPAPQDGKIKVEAASVFGVQAVPVTVVLANKRFNLKSGVLDLSDSHGCVVINGSAKCWGTNNFGQLGDGTLVRSESMVSVVGLQSGVTKISAGHQFSCAIVNRKAICWGSNQHAELGRGLGRLDLAYSVTPSPVLGLDEDVKQIEVGLFHACAVTLSGSVKCWGSNIYGNLGNGTNISSTTAVSVIGLQNNVDQISLGWHFACAILNDRSVKCWGQNHAGQLGNGQSISSSNIPVDVLIDPVSDGAYLSAGSEGFACVENSTNVKCWGGLGFTNYLGRGGDDTPVSKLPDLVVGLSENLHPGSLSSGNAHTCLVDDNQLKCWGINEFNEVCTGTTTNVRIPVASDFLPESIGISAITAGHDQTCIMSDDKVYCVGIGYSTSGFVQVPP